MSRTAPYLYVAVKISPNRWRVKFFFRLSNASAYLNWLCMLDDHERFLSPSSIRHNLPDPHFPKSDRLINGYKS